MLGHVVVTIHFDTNDRMRWAKSPTFSFSFFAWSWSEASERTEQVVDMLALPVEKVTIETVKQEVEEV